MNYKYLLKNLLLTVYLLIGININALTIASDEKPIVISNDRMRVVYKQNSLSFWMLNSQTPFFESNDIVLGPEKILETKTDKNPIWGIGSTLIIEDVLGNINKISLYNSLSFVMIQRELKNMTSTEMKFAKIPMIEGIVKINRTPEKLNVISTAGLRNITKPSGGYVFMAVGDPLTYNGVVCGWLTSERGGGIVFSDYRDGKAYLKAQLDYGDLRIPAGESAKTEILLIGYADDVRITLEQYADAISRQLEINLKPMPSVYCTWYHSGASDENKIKLNADFASDRLMPYGFNVMQIDDYWQLGVRDNGPRRNFTDVRPDGPYPSGMKSAADYIRTKGLTPGIWYIPFAGSWNDPFWKDKMDLFLKEGNSPDNYFHRTDGASSTNFAKGEAPYETRWGGTSLDLTNPKAIDYVHFIANKMSNEWGYKYLKIDGLFTGTGTRNQYINSEYKDDDLGLQIRSNPAITPLEAYAKGLKTVREGAGNDVFILGCCLPQNMRSFSPAMGLVDAMRVGPDNNATPQQLIRGPQFTSRVYFLNKRVWYNDPDPVYVRKSFPEEMAKTSVSWVSLSGSMHSSSEQYPELPENRVEILLRSLPSHDLKSVRPVDFLENDPATVWLLTDDRGEVRKDVIGLFNWDINKSMNIAYPLNRIDLPKSKQYVGFDFWADRFIPPFADTISGLLAPGGCKIISIRPVKENPQVISTSRHLTQGVIDLTNEKWNAKEQVLSGTSELVGNDIYELRIVVPEGINSWLVENVDVNSTDGKISSEFTQDAACIRVKILSSINQKVNWAVKFKKGSVKENQIAAVNLQAEINLDHIIVRWNKNTSYQYRLYRNGQFLGNISSEIYIDKDVSLGENYIYGIQAQSWNGSFTKLSETQIQMPCQYIVPAMPQLPDIYCTDLEPARAVEIKINQSFSGNSITLNGVIQKNGIGTKAPSTIPYYIPEGANRFVATVGFDETIKQMPDAKLVITVLGDVMEMGEPQVVLAKSPALEVSKNNVWHFDAELDSRLKRVSLMVEPIGKEYESCNVEWINPGFVKE